MNKQVRSRNNPSESFLSRCVSRIRYLGIQSIPRLVFHRLLPASVYYRSIRCVWRDLSDRLPQSPVKPVPLKIRLLVAEDLNSPRIFSGLDLDSREAGAAIASGVDVIAAFQGETIASYLFLSTASPGLNDHLILEFDERLLFFYRAFTRPDFRGHGLMPALLRAALERCASQGFRGVVACIDMGNRPSRRAFRSAGFKTLATIRLANVGGQYFVRPRRSHTEPRFRVLPVEPDVS
jgi:GNAT superfamily N-acetyltransferase